jgi:Ca2+-binding RTX toxin-like protein
MPELIELTTDIFSPAIDVPAYSLTNGLSLFQRSGTIRGIHQNSYGLSASGSGEITIGGSVVSDFADAVRVTRQEGEIGKITLLEGATVKSELGIGISVTGQHLSTVYTLANHGTITGLDGINLGGNFVVENHGTISSSSGATIYSANALNGSLTNFGVITGDVIIERSNVEGSVWVDTSAGKITGKTVVTNFRVTYKGSVAADNVEIRGSATSSVMGGGGGEDRLQSFSPSNVRLNGDSGNDALQGGSGHDTLDGGLDNDVLTGGAGNDSIIGGGGGNDTAIFSYKRAKYAFEAIGEGDVRVTHNADTPADSDGVDNVFDVRIFKFSDFTEVLWNSAPAMVSVPGVMLENAGAGTVVAALPGTDADGDSVTYSLLNDGGGVVRVEGNNLVLNRALDYETASSFSFVLHAEDQYGARVDTAHTIYVGDVPETGQPSDPGGVVDPPVVANQIIRGIAIRDTLSGDVGNDTIYGYGQNDRLNGGAGNDKLFGGSGRDLLTGGAGRDAFVFDSKVNKAASNRDKIADFSVADDTIQLDRSIFNKLNKKGTLKKAAFYVGDKAHDADDHIVYNKKKGILFYDKDGNGEAAAYQIATLKKNLKLTYKDFLVVA